MSPLLSIGAGAEVIACSPADLTSPQTIDIVGFVVSRARDE